MHKSKISKKIPRWFESHAIIHHGRFYKNFEYDDDIVARHIGIELNGILNLVSLLPLIIIMWLIWPLLAYTMAVIIILHGIIWSCVHMEMHEPKDRWFSKTWYYKWIREYHYRHHQNQKTNFNAVIPMWDYILGTYNESKK